jgi:hypothetical protein
VELEPTEVELRGSLTRSVIVDPVELLGFAPLEFVACPGARSDFGPIDAAPPQTRAVDQAKVSGITGHRLAIKATAEMISLRFGHEDILNQIAHSPVGQLHFDLVGKCAVLGEFLAFRTSRPRSVVSDLAEIRAGGCSHKKN